MLTGALPLVPCTNQYTSTTHIYDLELIDLWPWYVDAWLHCWPDAPIHDKNGFVWFYTCTMYLCYVQGYLFSYQNVISKASIEKKVGLQTGK